MQTTAETLSVNGIVLNTLAKNISSLSGRLRAPGHRTSNIALPGMHGELHVPNKKYQANTIVLPMWVQGCDDDGGIPEGKNKRRVFFENYNALVGLFKGVEDLLDVQWVRPDGSVRQCYAESTEVFDFTTDTEGYGAVAVVLTIPGAFWQDSEELLQSWTGNLASVKPTKFVGSSAPSEDVIYELVGPWTNPEVVFWDGSWFKYNAALAAGQKLTVDCGEWELTGTGFTPDYTKFLHDGVDAAWGALPAVPGPAAPTIVLNGTARTAATSFTLRGRRKYLIG